MERKLRVSQHSQNDSETQRSYISTFTFFKFFFYHYSQYLFKILLITHYLLKNILIFFILKTLY